jgi:hypothetical protein
MLFSAIQVNASSVEKCSSPETKEINAVTPLWQQLQPRFLLLILKQTGMPSLMQQPIT